MNTHLLAAEIVTKIRNSMQDSALNQALMVEGMIREALAVERVNSVLEMSRAIQADFDELRAKPKRTLRRGE